MPSFWKNLLSGGGSSSSASSNGNNTASSSSASSSSAKRAAGGTSSRRTSASTTASNAANSGNASNSAVSSNPGIPSSASSSAPNTPKLTGAGSQPAGISSSTTVRVPIGIPQANTAPNTNTTTPSQITPSSSSNSRFNPGGASSSLGSSTAATNISTDDDAGASNVAASVGALTDEEVDESAMPETPFSGGHSPSHARHRFPQSSTDNGKGKGNVSNISDDTEELDDGDIPKSPTRKRTSSSSLSSMNAPSNGQSTATRNAQSSHPDIPTTHTILANPLPQPSSGLAAAISSVLPSSSSSGPISPVVSSILPNGRSGSGTESANGAPRAFDIDDMIARLLEAGYSSKLTKGVCLKNTEITAICSAAREVFLSQPTLVELSPPVKIVGDIHGQYWDLIRLFEMCGFPPKSNYLFLGDYVDRGKQSLETILLLLCYKVKYPENFFLLRGNHECANVTRVYGFYDECKRRCNIKVWKTFVDVFNCLPITALVAGKIFCVHGGLSPSLSSMDDIRRIARPTDVPDYGLLNDLLWSDPSDTALDWEDNERGVSYCFGKAVIADFLAKYDFDLICRAHMVVEDGYEFWNERTLVTIFSAPNYCGEFDNFGGIMSVNDDLLCAFELMKPLDGNALKKELLKCRRKNSAALAAGRP